MGDIADMVLEGLLDEETGEYIGDVNRSVYGTEAPGFPISYERERHTPPRSPKLVECSHCGKQLRGRQGLHDHIRAKHREASNGS